MAPLSRGVMAVFGNVITPQGLEPFQFSTKFGTPSEIMQEIPALGFRRDRVIDIVPSQHVFVFKKTEAN